MLQALNLCLCCLPNLSFTPGLLKEEKPPLMAYVSPSLFKALPLVSLSAPVKCISYREGKKSEEPADNTALSNFLSPVAVSFSQSDGPGFD